MTQLTIDPARVPVGGEYRHLTGIYVRARQPDGGEPISVDITYLDTGSIRRWLEGGRNVPLFAENVVGILLGHGRLYEPEEVPPAAHGGLP